MRKRLPLRLSRVLEQRAAGGDRGFQVLAAVSREARRPELLEQDLAPGVEIEMPFGQARDRETVESRALGREDFRRSDAAQLVLEKMRRDLGDAQLAAREVEPREPHRALSLR